MAGAERPPMDSERWRRIKQAFSAALDVPTEQRVAWLSSALPEDSSLAREVQDLLAAHDRATDFYDQGALAAVTAAAPVENVERHLTRRPVAARRPTLVYRLGRKMVRHKLAAALTFAAAGVFTGLIAGVIVSDLLHETQTRSSRESALTVAETLTSLGIVSLEQQKYSESRRYFQRALALKEQWLGPTALSLAKEMNGLGHVSLEMGNLEEAERKFDRACAISRLAAESGPGDAADCYNNLGALASRRGESARAQVLFSVAFRYFRSAYGEDHAETIRARNNLLRLGVSID